MKKVRVVTDAELEKLEITDILSVRSLAIGVSVQEKCILNPDLKALGKIYDALARNVVKYGEPVLPMQSCDGWKRQSS